ncbi:MAG: P1 family peptidase [Syntrophales bacterium]|nr:P1 family peptidase [Syntrophales bacterium]MDD5641440.1 P1 family peptidase [Syntrophales bacterium]
MNDTITAVSGIEVGHWTDLEAATGCSVILCRQGAVAGVDVRGSAPGTRETDCLRPMNLVQQVQAVVLSGGSAYGLDAASGVMRWLEEQGLGFDVGVGVVPLVPAAVLFDLTIGKPEVRPGPEAGYAACLAANADAVAEGCIGAGTGATVGKLLGPAYATKSGLGSAAYKIAGEITVGALVAVNAFGDVVDPATGQIIAGTRDARGKGFADTMARLQGDLSNTMLGFPANTTVAVVATDAVLSKEGANKMAQMAHDGLAQAIRPIHTMVDGDTVFALATGQSRQQVDLTALGAVAASVLAEAVVRAVRRATSLAGVPAPRDMPKIR